MACRVLVVCPGGETTTAPVFAGAATMDVWEL